MQSHLVVLWRFRSSHRLFHRQLCNGLHHHRHSSCSANIQDWLTLPLAIWVQGKENKKPNRMHPHPSQSDLAYMRRFVGMAHAHLLRLDSLHHYCGHTMGQAALQAGALISRSVWQGGDFGHIINVGMMLQYHQSIIEFTNHL